MSATIEDFFASIKVENKLAAEAPPVKISQPVDRPITVSYKC